MAKGIARDVSPQVMRVSLKELKALGRFVRWEDVPKEIEAHAEGGESRSYPLFDSWLPPNEWIDVLDGETCDAQTWKRLRFVAFYPENDTLVVSEAGKNRRIAIDRWRVAPAGYFTDCRPDMSNARSAKLLLQQLESPGIVFEHAWVKDVTPPYITFEVSFYYKDNYFDERLCTMHAADPRVKIDGVKSREPTFNHSIAVSHRWMGEAEPDDREGAQYRELMELCNAFDYCDDQVFLIDYMSLPQDSRTVDRERFKHLLVEFQENFSRRSFVLNAGAEDFKDRAWCMLELMLAAIEGTILNKDSVCASIKAASTLAQKYEKQSRYHQHNLAHPPGADDHDNALIYGHIQATAEKHRKEIEDLFLNQFGVAKPTDRPLIIDLLRTLCFERRSRKR
jgi:hypothetical protein